MNSIALYFRYIGISVRGQMQYPWSFLLQTAGHGILTVLEVAGIWALFVRFGRMESWTLPQVCLFYGFITVTFAFADALGRGFDLFGATVKAGEFDRVLLRPRSTVLQIMGQELTLKRAGRLIQGMCVLIWAWWKLGIGVDLPAVLLLLIAMVGGICLFLGVLMMQATMCFWSTEALEVWNTVTYGGVESAQYPMAAYRPWFRRFFTFVIPLACIGYFPIVQVMGRPDPLGTSAVFRWVSPAAGFIFLAIAVRIWRMGVRRYTSAGN